MEMHSVLEAAANGFGTPCFAAFAFPSGRTKKKKDGTVAALWGAIYVLKKAESNLNSVIIDKVNHAYNTESGEEAINKAIRSGVKGFCKKRLLLVLARQAACKILNFDSKPGNVLLMKDQSVYLVDFDPYLYSSNLDFLSFEAALLINLVLLCVHIRAWCNHQFADAFVDSFRELILQLVVCSRSHPWLQDMKLNSAKFTPVVADTPERASQKLQSVVYSYFISRESQANYKLHPKFALGKPLLRQLVKFALTGSSVSRDEDILKLFGES